MKKLLLITLAVSIAACSSDQQEQDANQPNCDCDRVVEVNTFTIVGTPQNPAISYYSVYTTINDCTQIQRQKNYTTTDPSTSPQLNQCR